MDTSFKRAALCCALLASTALASPAFAQDAKQHRALDANGVDLTHGDFLMNIVEGSIGSGDGELALVRTQIDRGAGGGAYHTSPNGHQWDRIWLSQQVLSNGVVRTTVHLGGRFEQFDGTGTLPSGSTLSGFGQEYRYRSADGTVILFTDPAGQSDGGSTYCNGSVGQTSCVLPPASIASPDGKTVDIA